MFTSTACAGASCQQTDRGPSAARQPKSGRRRRPGLAGASPGLAAPPPRPGSPTRLPPPARTAAGRAATPRQPGPWFPLALSTMPRPSPGQPDCEVGWGETRLCKPFLFCKATEKACSGPPIPESLVHSSGQRGDHHVLSLPPSHLAWSPAPDSQAQPGQVGGRCVCGGAGSGVASSNAFCKCRVPGLRAPTVEFSPFTRGLAQSGGGGPPCESI